VKLYRPIDEDKSQDKLKMTVPVGAYVRPMHNSYIVGLGLYLDITYCVSWGLFVILTYNDDLHKVLTYITFLGRQTTKHNFMMFTSYAPNDVGVMIPHPNLLFDLTLH